MELYIEILFTALFSALLSFILHKLSPSHPVVAPKPPVFDQEIDEVAVKGDIGLSEKLVNDDSGVCDVNNDVEVAGGSLLQGEDEWEGIERGELEKEFSKAMEYAGSVYGAGEVGKLGNDVQMMMYGLMKVATEGPCYKPQPMALKVSSRAKWFAWQRLGSMSPEVAMEQYISLLTDSIPGWLRETFRDDGSNSQAGMPRDDSLDSGDTLHR